MTDWLVATICLRERWWCVRLHAGTCIESEKTDKLCDVFPISVSAVADWLTLCIYLFMIYRRLLVAFWIWNQHYGGGLGKRVLRTKGSGSWTLPSLGNSLTLLLLQRQRTATLTVMLDSGTDLNIQWFNLPKTAITGYSFLSCAHWFMHSFE